MLLALAGAACYLTFGNLRLLAISVKWWHMAAMKVGKQVKIVSYYAPDAIDRLKRLSSATRVPQAVYLREALDALLKRYAKELRRG